MGKIKPHPFVDIGVQMTNACNAYCKFCCNAGKEDFKFDVDAFKTFFDEVTKLISVNKVTFTGGEPTLRMKELNKCLDHIQGRCDLITVNTNGSRLEELGHTAINRIAVSRHHYLDEENNKIFGIEIGNPIRNSSLKDKIAIVCNLIRGKIDCSEEAYRMLEFTAENEIEDMSFVGLMPLNEWSKSNTVSLGVLDFKGDVLCTRKLCYEVKGVCNCSNHVYTAKNGRLVYFYMRHNLQPKFDKGSRITWENNEMKGA
jgi:molybdenum cofactor biosynthesis enzyme MoaA